MANATVPSGSFSEDVAAALVFAAADANAIPSPRLENVKLVVKTKAQKEKKARDDARRTKRRSLLAHRASIRATFSSRFCVRAKKKQVVFLFEECLHFVVLLLRVLQLDAKDC